MTRYRILVVDDAEIVGLALESILGEEGYDVDVALSGEDAVEKAGSRKYDIVIVDMVLPGMDGTDTLDHIGRISPDSKIILMSGVHELGPEPKDRQGGRHLFLHKPFGRDELLEVVRKSHPERERIKSSVSKSRP
jgi:DNA-binding NtrC family response regulator